jgi:hypothetical protein
MAQHDYVIANQSGSSFRSDLNNALSAIVSQNSGASAPSTTYAYQTWADTTAGVMKMRNGANSAWITLYQLDGEWSTIAFENGTAAAPSIYFKDSGTDTGIYSPGTDQVAISTGGTARVYVGSSGSVGIGSTNFGGKLTVKTSSSNGAPTTWGDGQLVVTAGDGTTAPGFGISTNTSDNSVSLSALTPGTGWNTIHYRAASHIFYRSDAASNEVGRFDTSGRLLVGTSSARTLFTGYDPQLQNEGTTASTSSVSFIQNTNTDVGPTLFFGKSRGTTVGSNTVVQANDELGVIAFNGADGTDIQSIGAIIKANVDGTPGSNDLPTRLVFSTTTDGLSTPTERMRIGSDGSSRFSMSSFADTSVYTNSGNGGVVVGAASGPFLQTAQSSSAPLAVNRLVDDGTLVVLSQAGAQEGSISVSGTTVSYNGAHLSRWSQLPGNATREEILRGTVLSNIDEMCAWGEEDNEQLNRMQVSDVEGDPNVAGVFQCWDDDDDTYTDDFYCAMTGDFIIRIAEDVTVQRGDLLMSAGDGTAKPQDDDIIRSKTIAKVTSTHITCTYDDGSYCVPCVLMAC